MPLPALPEGVLPYALRLEERAVTPVGSLGGEALADLDVSQVHAVLDGLLAVAISAACHEKREEEPAVHPPTVRQAGMQGLVPSLRTGPRDA